MGTEVLRPQDCLIQQIRVGHAVFNHRKSYNHNHTRNNNRKPPTNQRKKSPEKKNNQNQNQVQKVTILKRGDPVPVPVSAPALLPVPDLSPVRLSSDMYAGSSYSLSPSPRALPLPSFFSKKQVDDSATRDLRRLLRLD